MKSPSFFAITHINDDYHDHDENHDDYDHDYNDNDHNSDDFKYNVDKIDIHDNYNNE
jgi:hypothetical protein